MTEIIKDQTRFCLTQLAQEQWVSAKYDDKIALSGDC
jgi:hypothetical protein